MVGSGGGGEEGGGPGLDEMPVALLATVMTKLDVESICSAASTCTTLNSSASQALTFLPQFHLLEISPPIDVLRPLLPLNPHLRSLKVDCSRLDDSSIDVLVRPSLHELCLYNCKDFNGKLLSAIGGQCTHLRCLYLGSVAEKRGRAVHVSDLEELLLGCTSLEELTLMFDVSLFHRHNFARVWALASEKLKALQIGYISSVMVTELISPVPHQLQNHSTPSILPSIQKLCLSVDYINDAMVGTISSGLPSLTHLDLRDAPLIEPTVTMDLTNAGLQQINQHGKLKHLSLVRSQEYLITYFRRVNDLGMLLMADKCTEMEGIYLGGFCRVTDTGFKTLLHSCSRLYKLRISYGIHLTDLVFHDIAATSLSMTHVSLRWCHLLTKYAIKKLALNMHLKILDLRDCRNLGDEALRAISILPELKILQLDGTDISDLGMFHLRRGVRNSLVVLSVRGCKKLTDKCISALFEGASNIELKELDLSNLPYLSDNGIILLARSQVPISKLWIRQCPLISDTAVMALASMQLRGGRSHGSSLRLLDLYNCGGITQLAFQWLKKPYFPRLKWLGVAGGISRDAIDTLGRNRPFLHMASDFDDIGPRQWNNLDNLYVHDYLEVDEEEQWLLEGENDDEEMSDLEDAEDMME